MTRRLRVRFLALVSALVPLVGVHIALAAPAGAGASASVTAENTCAHAVVYGSLPTWARAGFSPANGAWPHEVSAKGEMTAVLWARTDPLVSPLPKHRANKILWVSKAPLTIGSNLNITAQRLIGSKPVGPTQHRVVVGGPGPSSINMPAAGCWLMTLRWSGHVDSVELPYSAGS